MSTFLTLLSARLKKGCAVCLSSAAIAGCAPQYVKPTPLDVHIAPECQVTCIVDAATFADDPINGLVRLLQDCDLKRQLCAAALKRAQDVGAIK